ncbi:MAG TPA: hypothetical protein VD908_07790 [Cytophagales bacterium]|nr:hypothetical protein [Cytophagales bacterium]
MNARKVELTFSEQKLIWESLTIESKRIQEKISANPATLEYWPEKLQEVDTLLKRFNTYLKPKD